MNQDVIVTTLIELVVIFGVWRTLKSDIGDLRRDITAQLAAVNTRIDEMLARLNRD